ncbi:MAG: potassium channel family protein [Actinobacteria bacterium]|nr:potassium channel family protein [Actinomycetota bacterium]
MRVFGPLVGLVVVAVTLLDLAWTTVAAGSGAGPVTSRLAGATWHAALAVHRRRRSHRFLAAAGVGIVFVILAAWILGVLIGWSLVFASSEGAVRSTATGQAAGTGERLYFTGYTVFTLGNGDFRPGQGTWQLATVVATGTGLVLVTLAITYLVPVASAVAQRRQLASYVSALGDDAADILGRAWDGAGFGSLTQHLVALAPLVDAARQRHLTYPVLHYYHSVDHTSAAARSLVNLALAVDALAYGVAPDARPDAAAVGPVDRAIDSFLDTLAAAYISAADEALPPLALGRLRENGIPTVDDEQYVTATSATRDRRHLLAGLLLDDGWELPTTAKENQT